MVWKGVLNSVVSIQKDRQQNRSFLPIHILVSAIPFHFTSLRSSLSLVEMEKKSRFL